MNSNETSPTLSTTLTAIFVFSVASLVQIVASNLFCLKASLKLTFNAIYCVSPQLTYFSKTILLIHILSKLSYNDSYWLLTLNCFYSDLFINFVFFLQLRTYWSCDDVPSHFSSMWVYYLNNNRRPSSILQHFHNFLTQQD